MVIAGVARTAVMGLAPQPAPPARITPCTVPAMSLLFSTLSFPPLRSSAGVPVHLPSVPSVSCLRLRRSCSLLLYCSTAREHGGMAAQE
jgi:hypothetical protein